VSDAANDARTARNRAAPPPVAPAVVTVTPNPALDWTLTVPRLSVGAANRADGVATRPGGKGVNVAVALTAWGRPVAATGFLGRANAAGFETFFADRGIVDHFVRVDGETRIVLRIVDTRRGETTRIDLPGVVPTGADIDALFAGIDALAADWFVLAGSLPAGAPPTLYAALIAQLRARGCRVLLDSSGDALHAGVGAHPDIVKPNVAELETLVGVRLSSVDAIVDAGRTLVEGGIELVVISLGADGALFIDTDGALLALPPALGRVATVGAGDAMVAGIVAGRLAGRDLDGIARLATAFAAAALTDRATTPDAIAGFEARIDVRAF
jgi:1-phosphofructokinase